MCKFCLIGDENMTCQKYMDRIEKLRRRAVDPVISFSRMYLDFFRRYAQNENLGDMQLRYADAFAYSMSKVNPIIDDDELIVGKSSDVLTESEHEEWRHLEETVARKAVAHAGQDSHMAIDYEKVLSLGINGIIAEIKEHKKTATHEQTIFYDACLICLDAVKAFAQKYSEHAKMLAESCADRERKHELLQISEICTNVPANPARSFYEAVQSVHFITFCLTFAPFRYFAAQQFQLGRPDRYLYPYYKNDIENGKLTPEQAQLLMDCLGIQINHRVPRGLSSGYMVGGRDRCGNIVANELTKICMQVVDDIRLVYPAVGLCVSSDTPDEYLELACKILSRGRSHPALFNDDVITQGLREYGVTEKESHEYIHSTCVEITPVGASNVWVASPYTNLPQLLLDILDREYETFDELLDTYKEKLNQSIKNNFEAQNRIRAARSRHSCNPLLSCFVRDCIARGVDIERGGARYNWIMPSFVGMPNLVDSLYVIKTLIFERKQLTFKKLKEILDSNFEGYEAERQQMQSLPKYGNDMDAVDSLFTVITEHVVQECRKYRPVLPGARLIPSLFCWIMHEHFGSGTDATPDGRLAGFPLGDGAGPAQGREQRGPTCSILSSTKWSHKELIGGVAVNMKFSKKIMSEQSAEKMVGLIKTYLQRGGFEMQINVVDADTLLAAQKNPEQYRDLLVRIGGYSDYFVKLSPSMQAEIIARTMHQV